MEDLKRRQKKKMEQTLLFEIKSQQAEAQHLANLEEQNARAERERKARERRKQQVEQAKRDKEMERKRQEDLETKLRRKKAMEQYKKEQEMNRLIAMKEKARQREQDRRNAELKEKQAQHRREMQEAYEAELRDQAKRQANMEEAERARLARVAKVQQAMQEQKAAQQRRKREKIEKAFKEQERMMQNKWNNFEDKMAQETQRKADWEREKSQNAERTRMRAEESASYIAGVQEKNDMLDEARKQAIHEKNRRAQENRERMARERDYKNALKREQQLQKRMDKLFHLERSKRIADYRKELAWQKMNRSDARTQALEQRKTQLLAERRKMRDLNREVRVSMQTSMEEFRTKKVFKLPEGIDTAFETPELQTIVGNSSGGALNLSAISAGTPGKPARSASAMEMRRPNSRGGGGNMSMASVDSGTTMVSSPFVSNKSMPQLHARAVALTSIRLDLDCVHRTTFSNSWRNRPMLSVSRVDRRGHSTCLCTIEPGNTLLKYHCIAEHPVTDHSTAAAWRLRNCFFLGHWCHALGFECA